MKLLATVFGALVLAGSAASAPDGFRESVRLTPVAQALSVPEARVYCAVDDTRWVEMLPSEAAPGTDAYTRFSTRSAHLMAWMCQQLEGPAKPLNVRWAKALLTFVHETIHLRGIRGEAEAECTAYRETAKVTILHFGIRNRRTLHKMMDNVKAIHQAKPAQYQAIC